MTDADFIIALMKTESDAVGFIPAPAIRNRWIPLGRYIIQHDRHGRRRGYLLHGPPRSGQPLYVHQCVIDVDHRLRGYAALAIRTLVQRGLHAHCSRIRLTCAHRLAANDFWRSQNFNSIAAKPGGDRRGDLLIVYELQLPQKQ